MLKFIPAILFAVMSTAVYATPEAQLKYGSFKWKGLVDDATMIEGGANFKLTNAFIPVSVGKYDGELDPDLGISNIDVEYTAISSGIGYNIRTSDKLYIPIGLRLGIAWMEMSDSFDSIELDGYNLSPFVGLAYKMTRRVSLGYEGQMPIFIPKDTDSDDDEDEDDEDSKIGLPQAHMVSLSIAIGESKKKKRYYRKGYQSKKRKYKKRKRYKRAPKVHHVKEEW